MTIYRVLGKKEELQSLTQFVSVLDLGTMIYFLSQSRMTAQLLSNERNSAITVLI